MIVRVHKCRPIMKLPIFAWIIMIFQGMKPWKEDSWSHMAISYLSITGDWKFADSTSKGVRSFPRNRFLMRYIILDTKILDIKVRPEEFLRWFEEHEGKEYDSLQIVGLALKVLGFVSNNTIGNNWKKLICSELVLSMLSRFRGIKVVDPDSYDLLSVWELV